MDRDSSLRLRSIFGVFRISVFVDVMLCFLVMLGSSLYCIYVPPFCRQFSEMDPSISFPFAENETIPNWLLYMICFPCCGLLLALLVRFTHWSQDVRSIIQSLLYSLTLCFLVTDICKIYTGRLRPDFLDRLERSNLSGTDWKSTCASYIPLIQEGRVSFPSGHSSKSFASLGVVSLQAAARLKLLHPRSAKFWKILSCTLPILLACVVAISRTRDFRHNFDDIVAGAVIGMACAFVGYFALFPPLWHEHCGLPLANVNDSYAETSSTRLRLDDIETAV